jgi:uncharacterized protein YndB with AHSA1/START domain
MSRMREVETLTVSIERPPRDVYEYVANPANLPRWASGLAGGIENVKGEWIAASPVGRVKVRFAVRNEVGVLDHCVTLPDGAEVYVPIRVVANGPGSELSLTLFRSPEMTDEKFREDAQWVRRDLARLKTILEVGN